MTTRLLMFLGLLGLALFMIFGFSGFDFRYGYTPYPSPNKKYSIFMTQTFWEQRAQGTFGTARVFTKSGELVCKGRVELSEIPLWVSEGENGGGLYLGDAKNQFFCKLRTSPE